MSHSALDFTLSFAVQSYWQIGSGLEGGAYADSLALKDTNGLPYIPGKSIKGLLKEAFSQAFENNWFTAVTDTNLLALLFGVEGAAGSNSQGLLQLTSATLSAHECHYFHNHPSAKSNLFKVTYSTAIDEDTGVASETSLRSMEVVVPMSLCATLSVNTLHPSYAEADKQITEQLHTYLTQVVSLISKLGAKRHRGFGQVIVTCSKQLNAVQGGH
jgi:CRISPR/Cas system CSM-associated protein Csm3 (group 7 of RAMP superfamily)